MPFLHYLITLLLLMSAQLKQKIKKSVEKNFERYTSQTGHPPIHLYVIRIFPSIRPQTFVGIIVSRIPQGNRQTLVKTQLKGKSKPCDQFLLYYFRRHVLFFTCEIKGFQLFPTDRKRMER